jgi:HECT-domain (ubiquitin-transferase)
MDVQFRAFIEVLNHARPLNLLHIFDKHELEMLIGGMTEIDMDNWALLLRIRRVDLEYHPHPCWCFLFLRYL